MAPQRPGQKGGPGGPVSAVYALHTVYAALPACQIRLACPSAGGVNVVVVVVVVVVVLDLRPWPPNAARDVRAGQRIHGNDEKPVCFSIQRTDGGRKPPKCDGTSIGV